NPSSLNPKIPSDLSDLLLKSMQITRDERFASAAEMRGALKQIGSANTNPQSAQKTEVMHFPPPSDAPTATPSDAAIPPPSEAFPQAQETNSQQKITEQLPNNAINEADGDVNSVETIAAPAGLISQEPQANTGSSDFPPPNANTAPRLQEQKKRSLKFLWAIPVLGLLFMFLGVGAVGAWWFWKNNSTAKTDTNSNVSTIGSTNDDTNSDITPEPSVEPTEDIFGGGENDTNEKSNSSIETDPTPGPETKTTPKPQPTRNTKTVRTPKRATPRPTPKRITRRPTPPRVVRATPKRVPTRTPKKKKDMNCILTDSCK
ncbi:MAG: hypothetical protein HKN25_14355, partial [Pyrinomonadaceae bacterium]|nr:hypothetical protein [Pyrinomonadaceae bacterium]